MSLKKIVSTSFLSHTASLYSNATRTRRVAWTQLHMRPRCCCMHKLD